MSDGDDTVRGDDGLPRCPWGAGPAMLEYHDHEWGHELRGDVALFERMSLEAFQSGLSWAIILRKREGFRAAFGGFDPATVAGFGPADVARLLDDTGIVRNRLKIEATIHNARTLVEPRHVLLRSAVVFRTSRPCGSAAPGRRPGHHAGVRRHGQRAETARFPVRRAHHGLRIDAGHGHGQRPSRRVRVPSVGAARPAGAARHRNEGSGGTYAGRMSTRTPAESSSAPIRRAPRSRRSVVAVVLLVSAVGVVVAAVVVGSTVALTAAGAYAVVAGIVAAVLLESVVAQVRRLWAYDRANLASAYRTDAVNRSAEQVAFAESMATRLTEHRARIVRLQAGIERAERRRDELGNALADEQERSAELEASLAQVQDDLAHLRDALTASEAAEKRARAEVVAHEAESRQLA